jgi:superfamily II DNA/RNA helicase
MHVINYDLPSMDHSGIEEYVHRIGLFLMRHNQNGY